MKEDVYDEVTDQGQEDMFQCVALVENPTRVLYFLGSYTGSWQDPTRIT